MSVTDYTSLITSEHSDKPKFIETIIATDEPYSDIQDVANQFPADFDVDFAIGVQLDQTGLWIGQERIISVPLKGVYFTWDTTDAEGWDNGIWWEAGDPLNETIVLDDDTYRALLKSKILSNQWKGDAEGVYPIIDAFVQTVPEITVTDNQDMSMTVTIPLGQLTATELSVLENYVIISDAAVSVNYVEV